MLNAYAIKVDMTPITCCVSNCGITWAVPARWERDRRRSHKSFFCPNGHSQHFAGKSDIEQAAEDLRKAEKALDYQKGATRRANERLASERRSKAAIKGHLTRIKRRIAAGVCPCCRRPFAAVMQHMRRQHPEFLDKWGLERKEENTDA